MTGSASSAAPMPAPGAALQAEILRAATPAHRSVLERLDWILPLPSRAAPGFIYLAGSLDGIAVGGGGADLASAAARCAGEGAEVLAQFVQPQPVDAPGEPLIDTLWAVPGAAAPRIAASSVPDGRAVGVPAAAVYRGEELAPHRAAWAPPASLGMAAGPDPAAARLAALLELIERDAAAAWWQEDRRPHQIDAARTAPVAARLARLRQGATLGPRATVFLDLPAAVAVPVVAAISTEAEGTGAVVGLKAATMLEAALEGAMLEMLQMELALEMARHRAAAGTTTPGDRQQLARAALPLGKFQAFAPLPPRAWLATMALYLDGIVAALATLGDRIVFADLPLPPELAGLAVAKAFAPGLRPLPGGTTPPRAGSPGARAGLL